MHHSKTHDSFVFIFLALLAATILFMPLISQAAHIDFANSRDLKKGMKGDDVYELQVILNSDPDTRVANSGNGSPGKETNNFGDKTRNAVKRLQEKYASEVLAPLGLTEGTGYVGGSTRVLLARLSQELWGQRSTSETKPGAPRITATEPKVINEINEELKIIGTGFTPTGNNIIVSSESEDKFKDKKSDDGTTLKFTFHFGTGEDIRDAIEDAMRGDIGFNQIAKHFLKLVRNTVPPTPEFPSGVINDERHLPIFITVKNENGTSNEYMVLTDLRKILLPGD